MNLLKNSRAPKQLGDFGENLVNYVLNKKGYEVAYVDHVGADLIAVKDQNRFAISVKTRNFKKDSKETRGYCFTFDHLENLEYFSDLFGMESAVAFVLSTEEVLEVYIIKVKDIKNGNILKEVKNGYRLSLSQDLIDSQYVDYSCWRNEVIGNNF